MEKYLSKIKNIKISDKGIAVLFFVGIFSFLYFTGTLNSGYHFIDDHTMIAIKNDLDKEHFLETAFRYTKDDFNIRFRPLFYPFYISEVQVFGVNFFALSLFMGVLAFSCIMLFYFGMRKLGYSFLMSTIFVLLMFLGSQSAIWWRLGTNEPIGILFLGLSFFFMSKCLEKDRYKSNNILSVVFLVLASLCKESFIVIIPAFALFKIWNEKRFFNITIKESLKKNKLFILPFVGMFIELFVIKFVVGTNQIGYAGVTSSTSEFIAGIKNILFSHSSLFNWIKLFGLLILFFLLSFLFMVGGKRREFVKSIKTLSIDLLFALMIIVPGVIMHAKSGMVERYLLPTTFGLAFLIVVVMQNTKQKILRYVAIVIVSLFLFLSFGTAKTSAIIFTSGGKETNALLSKIKKNSNSNSKILLVVDPVYQYEVSWSMKTYLAYHDLNNLYVEPIADEFKSEFELGLQKQWEKWFEGRKIENMNGLPDAIVFIDKKHEVLFFSQNMVPRDSYKNLLKEKNLYSAYFKNK